MDDLSVGCVDIDDDGIDVLALCRADECRWEETRATVPEALDVAQVHEQAHELLRRNPPAFMRMETASA